MEESFEVIFKEKYFNQKGYRKELVVSRVDEREDYSLDNEVRSLEHEISKQSRLNVELQEENEKLHSELLCERAEKEITESSTLSELKQKILLLEEENGTLKTSNSQLESDLRLENYSYEVAKLELVKKVENLENELVQSKEKYMKEVNACMMETKSTKESLDVMRRELDERREDRKLRIHLEEKISSMSTELKTLNEKYKKELENEKMEQVSNLQTLTDENDLLKHKIQGLKDQNKQLITIHEEELRNMNSLEEQIQSLTDKNNKLKESSSQSKNTMENKIQKLEKDLEDSQLNMKIHVEKLASQNERLILDAEEKDVIVQELRGTVSEQKSQLDMAQNLMSQQQVEMSMLMDGNNTLKSRNEQLDYEINEISLKLSIQEKHADKADDTIIKLKGEISTLKKNLNEVESKKEAEIKSFISEVAMQKNEIFKIEKRNENLAEKIEELMQEKEIVENYRISTSDKHSTMETEIMNLKKELEKKEENLNLLTEENNNLAAKVKKEHKYQKNLKKTADKATKQFEEEIKRLIEEKQEQEASYNELKVRMEKKILTEKEIVAETTSRLEKELAGIKKKETLHEHSRNKMLELKKEKEDVEKLYCQVKENLCILNVENQQLKKSYEELKQVLNKKEEEFSRNETMEKQVQERETMNLKKEIEDITERYKKSLIEVNKLNHELNEKIVLVEKNKKQTEEQYEKAEEEGKKLKKELDEVEKKRFDLQERIFSLTKENQELKDSLNEKELEEDQEDFEIDGKKTDWAQVVLDEKHRFALYAFLYFLLFGVFWPSRQ